MRSRAATPLVLAGLVGLVTLLSPGARAAETPETFGSRLLTLVNQARAQQGLAGVRAASGTAEVAATWTQHMAAQAALSHNPDLAHQLETHGSPQWTAYAENVGSGAQDDPDGLFRAYMQSAEHRDNVLGPRYRWIGIGVIFANGTAYNTLDFVDSYGAPAPAAAAPRPRPRTAATRRPSVAAAPVRPLTRTAPASPARPHRPGVARPPAATARPAAVVPTATGHVLEPEEPRTASLAAPVAAAAVSPIRGGSLGERLPVAVAAVLVAFVASSWLQEVRRAR